MQLYKRLLLKLLQVNKVGPVFIYRALSAISGIQDQAAVIEHFVNNFDALTTALEAIVGADTSFFTTHGICAQGLASTFKESFDAVDITQELLDIESSGVSVDTCFDPEYPDLLRHIYAPPIVLYRLGSAIKNDGLALAVVGSREATTYGLSCVELLVPAVARAGINIVSGGAVGIDAAAHKKTIENSGKTTVVLGSGLLMMYPYANKQLFADVLSAGGTIVSPFSMRQRPERGTFPARNRIIAGLAGVCLVVEASAKSGALITASYALDSNRTVCAVPGSVFSQTSAGCHELLKKGAVLISSEVDLLKEFGFQTLESREPSVEVMTAQGELSQEQQFFGFLAASPRSEEEIAHFLGKDLVQTQDFLFDLQLDGKIKQQFTGLWGLPV